MKRVTLFLKGNVDVHDSLHSCRVGGNMVWNGINEVLRARRPECLARLKHETWTRSDALLQANGVVPTAMRGRSLSLGAYPVESQFSCAVFETKAEAIILSLQPDISTGMMKHRRDGFLFYANESERWPLDDRRWLQAEFDLAANLDVAESMANFTRMIERIREKSEAPILIYNLSPIIPGERIHCHQGLGETYATRIRKFNLGLIELSENTGISIVDIDSLLARHGADALKLDPVHLHPRSYRLVAEELVRVLEDLGVLDQEPS